MVMEHKPQKEAGEKGKKKPQAAQKKAHSQLPSYSLEFKESEKRNSGFGDLGFGYKNRDFRELAQKNVNWLSWLTKKDMLLFLRRQFEAAKGSDAFKSIGAFQNQNEIIKLDEVLRYLEGFLNRRMDNEIPELITKSYLRLNKVNLGLKNETEKQVRIALCDSEEVKDVSSDICRLVFMRGWHGLPYKIRRMMWRVTKWGVEEANFKVENQESVNMNDNVAVDSFEFRRLLDEKKRLLESKEREIARLGRKHSGVKKRYKTEKEIIRRIPKVSLLKKAQDAFASLMSGWGKVRRNTAITTAGARSRYRATDEQTDYDKVSLFYDEMFARVDEKLDRLIMIRKRRFEDNEYGGIADRPIFKNCIADTARPCERYIDTLRQIVDKTRELAVPRGFAVAGDGDVNEVLPALKSFSQKALDIIWS
ncbi:hypothetical protein FACS189481_1500 [Clostridia bacterium]|nr:hypothetical protein FACS189481_1500 [Clostridia bacterium]